MSEIVQHVASKAELARVLGCSRAWIEDLRRREWFPEREEAGWPVESIRAAMAEHVRSRKNGPRLQSFRAPPRAPGQHAAESQAPASLAALRDTSDARETARAALSVSGAALADAVEAGSISTHHLVAMESSLRELRRTEAAWLELAEQRGRIVDREVAQATGAWVAQLCVAGLDRLTALLGAQVEAWLADGEWRGMSSEQRGRVVREWAERQVRELRATGAVEIDAQIERQREEIGAVTA